MLQQLQISFDSIFILQNVYWNEDASLVTIATNDCYFVLSVKENENGYDFELLHEIGDSVVSGYWNNACFIYNTIKGLKYYVGGEVIIIKHLNKMMHLLGYLEKENAAILVDKDVSDYSRDYVQKVITGIPLDRALLYYQTAVLSNDFDKANEILPQIGKRELEKLSLFLQGQGFLEEAIKVTNDSMRKLDLAISLKNTNLAIELLSEKQGNDEEVFKYWSQIAEICLEQGDMKTALVNYHFINLCLDLY